MGFLDKAKQMAEQAQQKIDDAQKQFNEKQATPGGQPAGGVRYDEHGRPVATSPDPTPATAPAADPAVVQGVAQPQPPEGIDDPELDSAGMQNAPQPSEDSAGVQNAPQPSPPTGGANANPDPFKPIG